jgi:hypothetical protein
MKTAHIKNIVIVALVAVNVFFLGFWLLGLVSEHSQKIEVYRDAAALLEQNGVALDIRSIRDGGELYTLSYNRDTTSEQALANVLLGSTVSGQSGSSYTSDSGQAVFDGTGAFTFRLSPGVVTDSEGAENAARKLLGLMNLEAEIDTVRQDGAIKTVTAVCTRNGADIFNDTIIFSFKDGNLEEISGTYIPGVVMTAQKTEMNSCASALMSFLAEVRKGNYQCSEIESVEPGYRVTAVLLGGGSLGPVWRVVTDTGTVFVDALTGKVEPAAAGKAAAAK